MEVPSAAILQHVPAIVEAAEAHGLDPALVAAIVEIESGGNQHAIRYEPGYRWLWPRGFPPKNYLPCTPETEECAQKMSWGLMQIMGAVAREHGFRGSFLSEMTTPPIGLDYGCRLLAYLIQKYGDERRAVSAYNAGRPTSSNFENYVLPVLRARERLTPAFQTRIAGS